MVVKRLSHHETFSRGLAKPLVRLEAFLRRQLQPSPQLTSRYITLQTCNVSATLLVFFGSCFVKKHARYK